MKRLQISLAHELDSRLARAAEEAGVSKAEIVRRSLEEGLTSPPPLSEDPLVELFGAFGGGGPDDSERHDDLIYG